MTVTLTKDNFKLSKNDKFNICDLLLLDHSYLKKCSETLTSKNADKKIKLKVGRSFLDTLTKHSDAEEKCVYTPLLTITQFKKEIIEGEIEHNIAHQKCKYLTKKLKGVRNLSDELEVELKVLAEFIQDHIKEEETHLIVQMRNSLSSEILDEMGVQFMKFRKFTTRDLTNYPMLRSEVRAIGKMSARIPTNFVARVKKAHHSRYSR